MSPHLKDTSYEYESVPRASGDEPNRVKHILHALKCSPRERG